MDSTKTNPSTLQTANLTYFVTEPLMLGIVKRAQQAAFAVCCPTKHLSQSRGCLPFPANKTRTLKMEEYFYELSLLQTVTNTSNKVISTVKTIVSCICILHTNSHTWCFSIFWAQWITAECLNCYRAPHFYFINLHLRKNCSLLTITSTGHCSKTERFSWIQCDCMSLPVAFLRLKTRID